VDEFQVVLRIAKTTAELCYTLKTGPAEEV
jgi:hypothetical protein